MTEDSKFVLRVKLRMEAEKQEFESLKKKYKSDLKTRSCLSSGDFLNRKSMGKYLNK